jgi:hypothetical protein
VIKPVIDNEHVVVLERLQEETNKDEQLLKLKECILKSDWERNKKDKDIWNQFFSLNICLVLVIPR